MFKGAKKFLKIAGPGVITGATDDDPSGIATYTIPRPELNSVMGSYGPYC